MCLVACELSVLNLSWPFKNLGFFKLCSCWKTHLSQPCRSCIQPSFVFRAYQATVVDCRGHAPSMPILGCHVPSCGGVFPLFPHSLQVCVLFLAWPLIHSPALAAMLAPLSQLIMSAYPLFDLLPFYLIPQLLPHWYICFAYLFVFLVISLPLYVTIWCMNTLCGPSTGLYYDSVHPHSSILLPRLLL